MKTVIIFFFATFFSFSQSNNPKISPMHSGAFSSNSNTYVVGTIYVKQEPVVPKTAQPITQNETIASKATIKIVPNPVTDFLTFETSDNSFIKEIAIYNMEGKWLYTSKLENNTIDVSFLKQGFYGIKINNDNEITYKIIKK